MIYDYNMSVLHYVKNGIEFHLQLRPRITIVLGDSGTGKSLLTKLLDDSKETSRMIHSKDFNNIVILKDASNFPKNEEALVVIDDDVVEINSDIINNIRTSEKLHFLIFTRVPMDIGLSPNYYGEFKRVGNLVQIYYPFNERLWF